MSDVEIVIRNLNKTSSAKGNEKVVPVHPMMAETAVAQWLSCCATNRKVAGSIPDSVIGIFH